MNRNFHESIYLGTTLCADALAQVGNVADNPTVKELIMKLGKLTMLSATALLAGGMSIAAAQSNMAPSGPSSQAAKPQGQCWDAASNTIKDKSGVASGAKTPGGVTTGSSPSGQANNAKGTGDTQTRPASAAGLPNC
jgi:hypothetical protein